MGINTTTCDQSESSAPAKQTQAHPWQHPGTLFAVDDINKLFIINKLMGQSRGKLGRTDGGAHRAQRRKSPPMHTRVLYAVRCPSTQISRIRRTSKTPGMRANKRLEKSLDHDVAQLLQEFDKLEQSARREQKPDKCTMMLGCHDVHGARQWADTNHAR